MPDFAATLGAYMRAYPNLYPEPRDAMVHLMITPGEWRQGQWIPEHAPDLDTRMDYSDLTGRDYDTENDTLGLRAKRFARRFVDEHMTTIASEPTQVFFRGEHFRDSILMKLIEGGDGVVDYPFLVFPDNIQTDWGRAVWQFQDWLQQQQRYALGFNDPNGDIPSDWPTQARSLYHSIESARRKLFPLLNNGADYDMHLDRRRAMASRLVEELISQEKNEEPAVLIKRKTSP